MFRGRTNIGITVFASVFVFPSAIFAEPVQFSGNGNYYDLVLADLISWNDARFAAESAEMEFMGMTGHLATVTSEAENAFINDTFNTGEEMNIAWLGGHEPQDDGVWLWAVGSEAGIQFSQDSTPTPPFYYANWSDLDPNDVEPTEDYLAFNIGEPFPTGYVPAGTWVDVSETPHTDGEPIIGYLIEYECPADIPTLSEWGLVAMMLLVLTAGTLMCTWRRRAHM